VIQITVQTRILVAIQAVDFRKGMDGLARVCQEQLQTAPFSGGLFVFRNRRRTALKVLAYDGRGFGLCQMRLSRGRFGRRLPARQECQKNCRWCLNLERHSKPLDAGRGRRQL
jgi:transposase